MERGEWASWTNGVRYAGHCIGPDLACGNFERHVLNLTEKVIQLAI